MLFMQTVAYLKNIIIYFPGVKENKHLNTSFQNMKYSEFYEY